MGGVKEESWTGCEEGSTHYSCIYLKATTFSLLIFSGDMETIFLALNWRENVLVFCRKRLFSPQTVLFPLSRGLFDVRMTEWGEGSSPIFVQQLPEVQFRGNNPRGGKR